MQDAKLHFYQSAELDGEMKECKHFMGYRDEMVSKSSSAPPPLVTAHPEALYWVVCTAVEMDPAQTSQLPPSAL